MFSTIYIENEIQAHPRTRDILSRFPEADIIFCEKYGEVFNRKAQNFRLQKKQPALILAGKYKNFVLPVPEGYGIGATHNYYFSHLLNCIYDCRYCFLQGMYRSANYVLFINYETFQTEIEKAIATHSDDEVHFFSGYDCDSLALEPVTRFTDFILPLFRRNTGSLLELRTKSTQVRSLLSVSPMDNCVVAFSFTPEPVAAALEHKTPAIERRIEVMLQLQRAGWNIGLRFDPLIYTDDFRSNYEQLINNIFNRLDISRIHSVSLGNFRLPRAFFKRMVHLYPEEILFASPLQDNKGMVSYKDGIATDLMHFCSDAILSHIPPNLFFPCSEVP